jgi:4,4'-diaponeurosporenoate glycosyltransferase
MLLFLDADTKLEPEGLEKIALTYLIYKGVISIQPYHQIRKFYENFASFFNLVLMGSINVFTPLQFRVKPIGAFGPCLLCDKDTYFSVGGHQSAKDKILEDLEIGKKFIKSNIDLYCFGGKGTINFRMYPDGLKSLINGFSRSFSTGAKSTSILNLLLIILWISGSFHPLTLMIGTIFNFNLLELITGIIFYLAYVIQINWMLKRIGNFNFLTAIFYPFFMIFFIIIFFWSIIISVFKIDIKWKERSINNKK